MMNSRIAVCMLSITLAIAGVIAVNVALAQGSGSPADIVISEVMVNAYVESPLNGGEWVEIYNRGHITINLAGWKIRDNFVTETITYSMCPSNSFEIPPKGCWLIAVTSTLLSQEFVSYTDSISPPSVLLTATIFLSSPIGNGLANLTDTVALIYTDGRAVDCVSWGSTTPTLCANLSTTIGYVEGGNGVDTNLRNDFERYEGQSITNIGGVWYRHQRNASPYNCINTAAGGNPTAVILSAFSVRPRIRPGLILAGVVCAGTVVLMLQRRR